MTDITVRKDKAENLLFYGAKPVLEIKTEYPSAEGGISRLAETNFNFYYYSQSKKAVAFARKTLYPTAKKDYIESKKDGFPFNLHSYGRSFTVTYISSRLVSLYTDEYIYSGGAHGSTKRIGQTWDMKRGKILPLSAFFTSNDYFGTIISRIKKEIGENEDGVFFPSARNDAAKLFSAERYVVTRDGFSFWYPLYSLAPYYAGIISFTVPFDAFGKMLREEYL